MYEQEKVCSACGAAINQDDLFCPQCGRKYEQEIQRICPSCGSENEMNASYCTKCGGKITLQEQEKNDSITVLSQKKIAEDESDVSLEESKKVWRIFQSRKQAIMAVSLLLVFFVCLTSAFIYLTYTQESRYLNQVGAVARMIAQNDQLLVNRLAAENLKSNKAKEIMKELQPICDEMSEKEKEIQKMSVPNKYLEEHKKLQTLLEKETTLLRKVLLVLREPLNVEAENILVEIKSVGEDCKKLSEQIQFTGISFSQSSDKMIACNELKIFAEAEKKLNKEKMDRLAVNQTFFQKVDAILQKYDNQKQDLGDILGNLRNGGYTWADYFNVLQGANTFRTKLREEINTLSAPKGTEELKRELSDVLTLSLQYCEKMRAGANIEFNTRYRSDISLAAQEKYNEATTINQEVQEKYQAFLTHYQTAKTDLTNIEKL